VVEPGDECDSASCSDGIRSASKEVPCDEQNGSVGRRCRQDRGKPKENEAAGPCSNGCGHGGDEAEALDELPRKRRKQEDRHMFGAKDRTLGKLAKLFPLRRCREERRVKYATELVKEEVGDVCRESKAPHSVLGLGLQCSNVRFTA
jgi:hypothetical protein